MAKDHSEHSKIKKAVLQEVLTADHSEKEKIIPCYQVESLFLKTVRKVRR